VKGRRRAREIALQALYELDASAHALETVLAARLDEFLDAGVRGGLPADLLPVAQGILARHGPGGVASLDARDVAASWGVDMAHARSVLAVLAGLVRQADYGMAVARGVWRNVDRLDAVIQRIAPEWPVDQMAPVDRNVLRIALWEIGGEAVPIRVAINEAVELARRYSGESARRMVNGALGAFAGGGLALELVPAEPAIEPAVGTAGVDAEA